TAKDMGISIRNAEWKKNWTIGTHDRASTEIKNLLNNKDLEKGTQALHKLNLWYFEQIITRQDNIMLTWQQIKRVRGIEMKGKTPQ
ncbi:41193_t:CDS:1, partial [Gigaspora margarita]